jgi:hypothetical protein
MKVKRGILSLREVGRRELRLRDPDDGFGYIRDLKRDARKRAVALGHDLKPFHARRYTNTAYNAECAVCHAIAVVNADPPPGVATIYGHLFDGKCRGR